MASTCTVVHFGPLAEFVAELVALSLKPQVYRDNNLRTHISTWMDDRKGGDRRGQAAELVDRVSFNQTSGDCGKKT